MLLGGTGPTGSVLNLTLSKGKQQNRHEKSSRASATGYSVTELDTAGLSVDDDWAENLGNSMVSASNVGNFHHEPRG